MIVKVFYDDEVIGELVPMQHLSDWFTSTNLNPLKGEHIFVPGSGDETYNKTKEKEYSGSGEWTIIDKFYEIDGHCIILWCMDSSKDSPLNMNNIKDRE